MLGAPLPRFINPTSNSEWRDEFAASQSRNSHAVAKYVGSGFKRVFLGTAFNAKRLPGGRYKRFYTYIDLNKKVRQNAAGQSPEQKSYWR
jgi:hypothetical protein